MERVHEGDPEKAGLALNRVQWRNLVRRTRDVCDAGLYSMCVTCVHKEEEGFVINPPSIVHAHLQSGLQKSLYNIVRENKTQS